MRKISRLIIIGLIVTMAVGCSPKIAKEEVTSEKITLGNVNANVQYSVACKCPNIKELKYEDGKVNVEYIVENIGNSPCDEGILIFANGIPQKLDRETYIHIEHLEKGEKKEGTLEWVPVVEAGDTIEDMVFNIGFMLNPKVVPQGENYVFGNNTSILPLLFQTVTVDESVMKRNAVNLSDDYIKLSEVDGLFTGKLSEPTCIFVNKQLEKEKILKADNGVLDIQYLITGGEEKDYIASLFINNELIEDAIDRIHISKGECANIKHTVALNSVMNDYNVVYITIVSPEGDLIYKSYSLILKK